jgi:serine/threonine protein kinase
MVQRNPRVIGGIYQTGPVISSGPMLTTYTGYNRNTGDVVGLQVIELPPMLDETTALGLLQPLERRKQVESQHVIHVYDWGLDGSRAYIATDPPRGVTLRHVLDAENIDLRRALELARQMARGLSALHALGIIDIDLRPELITVDVVGETDRAQLDDVGLRVLLRQLGYTPGVQPGDIGLFDPRYAAPEHIQQGQIGPWSDVYQLGLVIFEMVTGRLPFVGRSPVETGMLQVAAPAPRMAQFIQTAPQALQDLLDRALAKDPAQRFSNAEALARALDAIASSIAFPASAPVASSPSLPTISGGLSTVQPKGQTTEMAAAAPPAAMDDVSLQGTLSDDDRTIHRSEKEPGVAQEAEEGVIAYLYVEQQGEEPRRFPITGNYVIVGRIDPKRNIRPEIDLSSVDPRMTVSRQHARIRFEKTFFYIEDLKSRNKTRLGELTLMPLKAELLQHGDVIHFGSVRTVFRVPGMRDKPAPQ